MICAKLAPCSALHDTDARHCSSDRQHVTLTASGGKIAAGEPDTGQSMGSLGPRVYNVNVGVLGHVDSGKTSLGELLHSTYRQSLLRKGVC